MQHIQEHPPSLLEGRTQPLVLTRQFPFWKVLLNVVTHEAQEVLVLHCERDEASGSQSAQNTCSVSLDPLRTCVPAVFSLWSGIFFLSCCVAPSSGFLASFPNPGTQPSPEGRPHEAALVSIWHSLARGVLVGCRLMKYVGWVVAAWHGSSSEYRLRLLWVQ